MVNRKSMLGHVINGRHDVKCPQLSTKGGVGGGGQNWVELGHVVVE